MKIGLIGHGYWGKNVLRNLVINDKVNSIYVYDISLKKSFYRKNIYFTANKKNFFEKEIDIFIITTPTKTHFELLKKCLLLNKTVCVTKPFTNNFKEINKLKKQFSNLHNIFLDHTYLFHSSIKFLKRVIEQKKIGKLIYYDSERISFGKFYSDVNVIEDLAVHDIYILDFLLNGETPTKIDVNSHKIFGNKNFISNISLVYPSGFFANIKVSWYSPIKSRRILLAGNKKIIEFDDNESDKKIKIYNKGIEYHPKKKINQWLYRTGEIEIPNIFHQESLGVMINELLKFHKTKKNRNKTYFNHGERVIRIIDRIKKKL